MDYKILICDDDRYQIKFVEGLLTRASFDLDVSLNIQQFTQGEKALEYLQSNPESVSDIHVFLLDIEMPDVDGLTIGKYIKYIDSGAIIVYITGFRNYAVDAFGVRAFNYMMKPITYEGFLPIFKESLSQAQNKHVSKNFERYFLVDKKEGSYKINYDDILYFEKYLHKIIAVTEVGEHEFYGSFKVLKDKLEMNSFVQCHQSYIVNLNKIDSYKLQQLTLKKGKVTLPVSKASIKEVKESLSRHVFSERG